MLSYDVTLRYGDALADLLVAHPDDIVLASPYNGFVGFQPGGLDRPIDTIEMLTQGAVWTDEWGTRREHAAGGVGASPIGVPLGEWSQLEEYLADRMPDAAAPGRLDEALPATAIVPAAIGPLPNHLPMIPARDTSSNGRPVVLAVRPGESGRARGSQRVAASRQLDEDDRGPVRGSTYCDLDHAAVRQHLVNEVGGQIVATGANAGHHVLDARYTEIHRKDPGIGRIPIHRSSSARSLELDQLDLGSIRAAHHDGADPRVQVAEQLRDRLRVMEVVECDLKAQ